MDVIVVVVLCLIIVYQVVERYLDRRTNMNRESELLNRIMAKNYLEYAKMEPRGETFQVVKVDDLLKEQQEKGIPVY